MARKRLTAPQEIYLARTEVPGLTPPFSTAPIAMIAGEATAVSGLRDMASAMEAARAEGRLVQSLPLAAIEDDHLIRDRVIGDQDEMTALKESLRARGQQQPIDVVDLGGGRYGLISGWRRLSALRELHAETGEARFGHVQALLRRPDGASDAYLAMVEENEIRAGLSHYERARIAALAAEQGVFSSPQEALRHLFANASRAKRSKIGSFMVLHRELGDVLAFPAAIPERLGLALAQALEGVIEKDAVVESAAPPAPGFGAKLRATLAVAQPKTAEEEARLLTAALRPEKSGSIAGETLKEIKVETVRTPLGLRVTLTGNGITDRLVKRLADWLARQD
jgi:ParB-like chromosome segregation protein Spo0J